MRFNVLMGKIIDYGEHKGEIVEIEIPMYSDCYKSIETRFDDLRDPSHFLIGIFPDPYDTQDSGLKKCGSAMVVFFVESLEEQKAKRSKTYSSCGRDYKLTLPERRHLWDTLDKCVSICADTIALFLHMEDRASIEDKYTTMEVMHKDIADIDTKTITVKSSPAISVYKKVIPFVRRTIIDTLKQYPLTDDTIDIMKEHLEWEY